MKEYISDSPKRTEEIGGVIADTLNEGKVIALFGGMGTGKTCITTGIAKALGYSGEISSPTFAVVNEYIGGRIPIAHFDMYRITDWNDLYTTGFFDYIDRGYLLIVEWSENIEGALDEDAIKINMEYIDETHRKITVNEG